MKLTVSSCILSELDIISLAVLYCENHIMDGYLIYRHILLFLIYFYVLELDYVSFCQPKPDRDDLIILLEDDVVFLSSLIVFSGFGLVNEIWTLRLLVWDG